MVRQFFILTCAILWAAPLAAQTRESDPAEVMVRKFERSLNAGDRPGLLALFAPSVPERQVEQYTNDLLVSGAVRTTLRERARAPLEGAPPGDGYTLIIEFFIETAGKARILTAGMDIRRPPDGDIESWRFVGAEGLTSVEGLYKIRLNTSRPLTARNLEITSEDLVLSLQEGTVYLVECDDGVTGLVLIGRGEIRFSPTSAAERGQVKLFSGNDTLTSPFEEAYIRLSPSDYEKRVTTASLTASAPQERLTPSGAGNLRARVEQVLQRRSPGSQQRLVAPAPTGRRLPRRSRYTPVRHTHVHTLVAASGRHHAVPAERSAHDRTLSFGRQTRRTWALLQ